MPDTSEMVTTLTEYIVTEVASTPPETPITPDFLIIEGGLVDSLGLFKLISFIEERYPVRIPPEEILFENFSSIGAIVRMVESKLSTDNAAQVKP